MAVEKRDQLLLAHPSVKVPGVEAGVILEKAMFQDLFDGTAGVLEEVIVQKDEAHIRGLVQHCPNWLPSRPACIVSAR